MVSARHVRSAASVHGPAARSRAGAVHDELLPRSGLPRAQKWRSTRGAHQGEEAAKAIARVGKPLQQRMLRVARQARVAHRAAGLHGRRSFAARSLMQGAVLYVGSRAKCQTCYLATS